MSAADKTPAKTRNAATPGKGTPVDADGSASRGRASPTDSAKKLKIFHYFGGGASAPESTPGNRRKATPTKAAKTARRQDREVPAVARPVADRIESPPTPAPTWGKLVDPRKKRRWDMLRRLQEKGGHSSAGVDPTAWARRSYSLSYTSVFQDGRVPGMGSTSAWGWASQSHVFGGARSCLVRSHSAESASDTSRRKRSENGDQLPILGGSVSSETHGVEGADSKSRRASPPRGSRRSLHSTNFRVMVTWLSSSHSSPVAARTPPSTSFEAVGPEHSLLEIALERRDGGPAAAFMALMSLAPGALAEPEETEETEEGNALALALRLYNLGSTWLRVARDPARRQQGQGPGSRRHPNSPDLAAAVDEADERERQRRSTAEHAAALVLLNAGVAVSLADAPGGSSSRASCDSGVGSDGGSLGKVDCGPDVLAALAWSEALAAAEVRLLAKTLGIASTVAPERGESRARWGGKAKSLDRRGSGASGGGGSGSAVQSMDEACQAVEQWLIRPEDAAKRRSRLARAAREAADLVRTGKGGRGCGGESGRESGVMVLRLTEDAREAIHRVHVAFFGAARHGPHDVPAVLREDFERIVFGGADGAAGDVSGGGGNSESAVNVEAELRSAGVGGMEEGKRPPAPHILSSVEAFSEYYRLAGLSDAMELAAGAGDAELAYGSLHEASTALFPSGCPLCRHHLLRQRTPEAGSSGVNEAALTPPPHCDICELSARVVMRGVGLMERDKDYDSAFHYLEILLQAASQRLSVHRAGYWVRLVTDLGHKKRATEALRACEKALSEASPAGGKNASSPHRKAIKSSSDTTLDRQGSGRSSASCSSVAAVTAGMMMTSSVEEQAAAILPLGESLPLQRRAVRLAVPPLRWRRRPPPEIRQAQLRVMSLDLSWRRAGTSGGPASPRPRGVEVGTEEEEGKVEDEEEEEDGGGGLEHHDEDKAGKVQGTGKIAPGTSLEQAVLDTMLAELGPGWTGLHSENSICLGLFGLVCWDALFSSLASVPDLISVPSVSDASTEVGVRGQKAPSQDPQEANTTSGWDGIVDGRSTTIENEDSLEARHNRSPCSPPPGLVCGELARDGFRQRAGSLDEEREGDMFHPFPSPFQSEPADLMTPAFAGRRRHLLEGLFASVERGEAVTLIRQTWSRHYGKACTGLNWNLFPDGVEGWAMVASAIGPRPLSRVCRNLAYNYWAWRHGLPDLFLWRKDAATQRVSATGTTPDGTNVVGGTASTRSCHVDNKVVPTEENETHREAYCKWVEVKGPGDSLSCAQEAWIDALVGAGADFFLLRVEDAAVLPA